MKNADKQKDKNSSLFHQEGRICGLAMLTMRVFLDQINAIQWENRWLQVIGIIDRLPHI